jgi:hypothetical protein
LIDSPQIDGDWVALDCPGAYGATQRKKHSADVHVLPSRVCAEPLARSEKAALQCEPRLVGGSHEAIKL